MEQRQVFLEENRSVSSVNAESNTHVGLSAKTRLLPYNNVADTLSLYQVYNDERDACEKYRMIFTINPICSNPLYNTRTEFVRYEGSSACTVLLNSKVGSVDYAENTEPLTWQQALRDSEYTHPEVFKDKTPYVYHCGWDIFDNHMLRNDDFVYINKVEDSSTNVFNTISDYVRNNSGKTITEKINITKDASETGIKRHIYQYDNILTIYNAFANRLAVKNGWYGFTNPGNIEIPNIKIKEGSKTKWVSANRLMNNNKACEFIDLYPDRSLFSFIPKVNKYRRRLERNWDYCLTYPYESDMSKLNEICGLQTAISAANGGGAIRILDAKIIYTNAGTEMVQFMSIFKHTLESGDYVWIYYMDDSLQKYPVKIKVESVGLSDGTDSNRYFTVRMSNLANIFAVKEEDEKKILVNRTSGEKPTFWYKKDCGGYEAQYYFRKFKKIRNANNEELSSEINKLAYGENIYGDRVAQIIFTDSVDVTGLLDNMGRPVSELYLTIIKANRGHSEWYDIGHQDYGSEEIEFSHCFGEVTSGLDMPWESAATRSDSAITNSDYNVRRLHNIDKSLVMNVGSINYKTFATTLWKGSLTMNSMPTPIESDITEKDMDVFYGDIVEFDPSEAKETTIEYVYHRFNTAQRETVNSDYYDVIYDRLDYDDFDTDINKDDDCPKDVNSSFLVRNGYINSLNGYMEMVTNEGKPFPANLNPEGYYYQHSHKVQIRQVSDIVSSVDTKVINYIATAVTVNPSTPITINGEAVKDEYGNTENYCKVTLIYPSYYTLTKGDTLGFYDKETTKTTWLYINNFEKIVGTGTKIECIGNENAIDIDKLRARGYTILLTLDGVATYANYLPNSKKFVWRSLVAPSELPQDSELYDMPFANGHMYVHTNVNFFLQRQDPRNEFKMLVPEEESNPLSSYRMWGYDHIDTSGVKYRTVGKDTICY